MVQSKTFDNALICLTDPVVWSATPTPFLPDGALDTESVARLVERHADLGVQGIFMGGTCGEGGQMSFAQRFELVRLAVAAANGRLRIAVQVSASTSDQVRENLRAALDAGADAVVIAEPPEPLEGGAESVRRYFLDALHAAQLPMGLYLTRRALTRGVSPEMAGEICASPDVLFVKDSSMSEAVAEALLAAKRLRPELAVMTGNEFEVVAAAAAGYDGGLLGGGILIGGMMRTALRALRAGDRDVADLWQERVRQVLFGVYRADLTCWLGGLKYALARMGVFQTGFTHLPQPMEDADRTRIEAALDQARSWVGVKQGGDDAV